MEVEKTANSNRKPPLDLQSKLLLQLKRNDCCSKSFDQLETKLHRANLLILQQTYPANDADNHPHEKYQQDRQKLEEVKPYRAFQHDLYHQMPLFSQTNTGRRNPGQQMTLQDQFHILSMRFDPQINNNLNNLFCY